MSSIFSQNLKFLREKLNLKQDVLAQKLDISRSVLSYYENDKSEPTLSVLIKLSVFFNISIDDLISQELFDSNSANSSKFNINLFSIKNLEKDLYNKKQYYLDELDKLNKICTFDIPEKIKEIDTLLSLLKKSKEFNNTELAEELLPDVIDLEEYKNTEKYIKYRDIPVPGSVSAGDPCYVFDDIIDTVSIPEDLLSPLKEYYILYIKGDSMNELFKPGEPVLIEYTNYVLSNDIAIVLVGTDEATIKKVTFDDDYITLIPMSTNPKHKPKTHNIKDVCIQGKVVGKLSDILGPSL